MYASPGNPILTDLAARVPVQEGPELLGTGERSRSQRGQDVCGTTQVSIISKECDEPADTTRP